MLDEYGALNHRGDAADVLIVLDVLHRERAGRSAMRQYRALARTWRRDKFGRRAGQLAGVAVFLLLILAVSLHMGRGGKLIAGVTIGMLSTAAWALPEILRPSSIRNWEHGAWGEQLTAVELRPLQRENWLIRHDLQWYKDANHDHVAVGPAAYLLNSKFLDGSSVWIEGGALKVRRPGDTSPYVAEGVVRRAASEARSLAARLEANTGSPVHVYPVVVIWANFPATSEWVDEVAFVQGDALADWLRSRPADFVRPGLREEIAAAVAALPRAGA